jgi:hypothetical protein
MPIGGDQIPARGLTGGKGKVGKRFRGSWRSWGWPVLGKRGTEAAYRRRTGAGGGAPRGGDGVLVAGGQEVCEEVARKLPQGDVVLMVCLAGAKRQWVIGTTARPSDGGSSSSPARWSDRSSAEEQNWAGLWASVRGGGAAGALDRGWKAAGAAVDGEPRQRRSSGESTRAELQREYSSGGRKERQCDVVECVKEVERDSWASFKAKRSMAQVEQLLASSAARVAARATAARRGGAGRGPARGGVWRAWHEERQRGATGARAHGQ